MTVPCRTIGRRLIGERPFLLPPLLALLVVGVAMAPAPLAAQGASYTTLTSSEFGGAFGAAARLTGAGKETRETTYIEGSMMRTDSEDGSTIVDLESGRFIWIDHESKTYTVWSMDDMVAAASSLQTADVPDADGEPAADGEPEVEWEFELNVDRTGRSEEIAGYRAEQVIMTLVAEATVTEAEDAEERAEAGDPESMQVAFVNDMWVSAEPAAYRLMQELGESAAMAEAFDRQGAAAGLQGALAQDPRMRAGLERAAEEAGKIDGMTLRSASHVVLLPPGKELDVERALSGAEAKGPDVAGAAKQAVSNRLGGLLGRRRAEPEPEEPEQQQSTVMTIRAHVTDLESGPLPAGVFDIPAGYTETQPEGMGG